MTKSLFKDKYRVESTRLPNRNYAANGWYFVTICTRDRIHFFGNVSNSEMQLSAIGQIAQQFWADIPNHFVNTYIDTYVIMPNHVHGMIVIDRPMAISTGQLSSIASNPVETRNIDRPMAISTGQLSSIASNPVETRNFASLHTDQSNKFAPLKPGSLQTIIHAYKSSVTRWCGKNGFIDFRWQPRFYDHIIRADGSLDRIRQYIINNPANWINDQEKPANLWM